MIGVGASSSVGVGEFLGVSAVNNQPVVTPPGPLSIQFANGGAGLSKTNAQLVAWGQSGSGTDAEDGAIVVAADFSALPATIPAGTYSIPFRSAADSGGLTGVAYANLVVSEAVAVNAAPVSSGNYSQISATVGDSAAVDAAANFSDPGDTLTYAATGLPPGRTINSVTGQITGTYTTAGGYTATITATDSVGQTATALLPVVVAAASASVDTSPVSGNSIVHELFVGDVGRLVRLNAEIDMTANTGLSIVFTNPNGTRIEKTKANGVRLGTVDVTDPTIGLVEAGTYLEYENEEDLFLIAGKWSMQLLYLNSNATPPDRYYGYPVAFKVNSRPDLQ